MNAVRLGKEVAKNPGTERKCCPCGRFICEIEGNLVRVLCPKCKRMVNIYTRGVIKVEYE